MELRQLRYFEAVGRLLNFSKAAEELHMAQPPLSRQIQNLEDELGVTLIDRSGRPLRLTNAGQFFYDQSVQMLARIAEIKRSTQQLGAEQKRWMGIGFTPSVLYTHIPKAIQKFTNNHANVHISLSELTSVQQADALKSGRIDVGFSRLAINEEGIENIILNRDRLMLAVPSEHALAALDSVTMEQIAVEKVILYPASPRPSLADQILSHFKVRGLELRNTFETNTLQTALGLVAANMGVTIVPQSVRLMQRSDIHYLPIAANGMETQLVMSVRASDDSAHLAAFRDCVSLPEEPGTR
ncbi:LysR family transcriptional regulator [Oceanobacter mangrovi]|uniref:LysR family transcriptional regulator n=1 Tax=Oceanobacter mangrovi TaxID=2862510 RepID=UPI001C8EA4D1|nr:LysR family transcriptional regulator [Oceanobacter mangrovi]